MSSNPNNPKLNIQAFADQSGEYKRKASVFRDFISSSAGSKFLPEKNRYHLYVSYACPWAHRTLIVRALKGLVPLIGVSVVHWHMDNKGWRFPSKDDQCEGATPDEIYGFRRIRELYLKANSNYDGRFTVPVLWDKKNETIVNNESSEIIRMFNTDFNSFSELSDAQKKLNFYPDELKDEIDELNEWIYDNINNGVYKSGFATKQEVYETHVKNLFKYLGKVEEILKENYTKNGEENSEKNGFYLVGNRLTEADIRLYTTIIRFDAIYVQHFKCNLGMIRYDFSYLHKWVRYLYWKIPGFKETTNFDHIKFHYTKSHPAINPYGITPLGPKVNILPYDG
ncbi:S-glutathionyl-(chloro)hydroquinone reductase [Ascoidea rubescens DSM 1968]|uniref:Extracellular matrix protein 4 n=1 Tax=Ascoidea rubescens DSM 1968 TaxID=1344418 RepID=A0A1D2VE18_9ASCO|nr:extracellular matrix protein 4 [Ascoidea rubescens DSM 1968]ODV59832.1 extracellular matrix protein 4 [Ascoidea rubescens DSM 1968]